MTMIYDYSDKIAQNVTYIYDYPTLTNLIEYVFCLAYDLG